MTATVQPTMDEWITSQLARGCSVESMVTAMEKAGWQRDAAVQRMQMAVAVREGALSQANNAQTMVASQAQTTPQAAAKTEGPVPYIDTAPGETTLVAAGRKINICTVLKKPQIVVMSGVLTPHECDALIALAAPRMQRSLTVARDSDTPEAHDARTSRGMFFRRGEIPLVHKIEERLAALTHWPLENGEGLQILNYGVGAEYRPHYDYFDPQSPSTAAILKRGGQRVGTLVLYLNTPEKGGATTFPDLGLEVPPHKGSAVFFAYGSPTPESKSLHGGAPVLAGEKWVATKWLREGVFV